MSKELAEKSIGELAPLIQARMISPVEVTDAVFSNIKERNGKINAYIDLFEDQAIEMARLMEKEIMNGKYRGPLHGIPMALKDNLYFKGQRVTVGSKIHQNFIPDYDATVVEKLKDGGVIFTGTLHLHEYASGNTSVNPHYGNCRNPWDLNRVPSGSSGGSGAAVAADMTIASLGTDTGGSVRGPANVCGIVGLKPTHGRISKYGCFPLAWSLDHIGPMTKTVYDSALLLSELAGFDENDPSSINLPTYDYTENLTGEIEGMVIGINEEYFFDDVDPAVEKMVRVAIRKLEELGAKLERVKLPSLDYALWAQMITISTEASAVHHENLLKRPEDFGTDMRRYLDFGEIASAVDYLQAQQIRLQMKEEFNQLFKKVDVLISPTHPFTAALIGQDKVMLKGKEVVMSDNVSRFTRPANLTGIPALSIPCGLSNGLPVGMQIMGGAFQEHKVLNVAKAVEQLNLLGGAKAKGFLTQSQA